MTRDEALELLSNGHALYDQAVADGICDALGVTRVDGRPRHSDPPGTFKGLTMQAEGVVCVEALDLGEHACRAKGLQPGRYMGRGSQAREYVRVLQKETEHGG